MGLAKARGIATILVGHVTKDGALGGSPRCSAGVERPYRELARCTLSSARAASWRCWTPRRASSRRPRALRGA